MAKILWGTASVILPGAAIVLFVLSGGNRRSTSVGTYRVAWRQLAANILFLALGFSGNAIARQFVVLPIGKSFPHDYGKEWWAERTQSGHPALCLAMSGGGIRSAAFNIGVLKALHELGLLQRVDIMSAVSGGSYALSWFFLQHFYARPTDKHERKALLDRMFDPNEIFQKHLAGHARQLAAIDSLSYYMSVLLTGLFDVTVFNFGRAITWISGDENLVNSSSVGRTEYRESLQRTFQGFPDPKTGELQNDYRPTVQETAGHRGLSIVSKVSFEELAQFAKEARLPFFVFNTTLDVAEPDSSKRELLSSKVFELNGWGLGSDSYGYAPWKGLASEDPRLEALRLFNVAPAISGAAISPAPIHDSKLRRGLLILANLDLGYFVPRFRPGDSGSLYLSDGGHSENLGVYALVRRGCRNLVVVDAEYEPSKTYEFKSYRDLQKVLREERDLEIRVPGITTWKAGEHHPTMTGTIKPVGKAAEAAAGQRNISRVFYIKLAMSEACRTEYPKVLKDPRLGAAFPQDPTLNQNFSELQFTAYRELGHCLATKSNDLIDLERDIAGRR